MQLAQGPKIAAKYIFVYIDLFICGQIVSLILRKQKYITGLY